MNQGQSTYFMFWPRRWPYVSSLCLSLPSDLGRLPGASVSQVKVHDALLFTCALVNTTATIVVPWLVISLTRVRGMD